MELIKILTPDEREFKDALLENKLPDSLHDYIQSDKYDIVFIKLSANERRWWVGFKIDYSLPHETPDFLLSFNLIHNNGKYLPYKIKIEKSINDIKALTNIINVYELEYDFESII